jgi:hypothetical protein
VQPVPANRRDAVGPGEVESGKTGETTVIPLHYSGGGEGRGFSYLLESHMTYLAGLLILRSWPGIWVKRPLTTKPFIIEPLLT